MRVQSRPFRPSAQQRALIVAETKAVAGRTCLTAATVSGMNRWLEIAFGSFCADCGEGLAALYSCLSGIQ